MRIQNINQNMNFCTKNSYNTVKKTQKQNHHTPMQDGLTTAGEWFGFGLGFDFLSRKLQISKSPMKNSLVINSILGAGAGIYTGLTYKKKHNN